MALRTLFQSQQFSSNPARFGFAAVMLLMLCIAGCGGGSADDATVPREQTSERKVTDKLAAVALFDVASAIKVADENQSFTLTAPGTVYYGANGVFQAKNLAAGTYRATNDLFGDPIPGVAKAAYVVGTDSIAVFDPTRAIRIAGENETFTLTTTSIVFYGANGTYGSAQLGAGTYTANRALFGDPMPGWVKSAYVLNSTAIAPFDPVKAIRIAGENSAFTLTASATVYFGANDKFVGKPLAAGTYFASNALFGDPISGVAKAAYVLDKSVVSPFDVNAATKVAVENGSFTLTSSATVYFGANDAYTSKVLAPGTYQATTTLLGDAIPGVFKTAYVMDKAAITPFDPATAVKLAGEGSPFYLSAPASVFFGASGAFTMKQLAAGTYYATSSLFGDPISGVFKSAYVMGTASIPVFDPSVATLIAGEGQSFTLAYPGLVFFGAGSSFSGRLLPAGTYYANASTFADLAPGQFKTAYLVQTLDTGPRASAPPAIVTQPSSAVVNGGEPVTFAVTVSSETVVLYQWSRDGVPIPKATLASYTVPATRLTDSGARFTVAATNNAGMTTSNTAMLTVNATAAQPATALHPFSVRSFWNSRPTLYTLGTYEIPSSYYYPTVGEGDLSTGAFAASNSDPAVSVMGPPGANIYIADAEAFVPQITIPHWPAGVVPASGGDGHADIIDVAANKIHSFYQLRKDGNQWRAAQYTWTALDGSGWGTPGQYFQGSRATGVVPIAGLIRTAELTDGLPVYKHALAMSLSYTGLAANPAYTFPATSADINAAYVNSGSIPEGALMMLPADFDLTAIKDPRLLKIARTLQSYGAYVVDANTGTPFVIYVELGSGFQLMPSGKWDPEIAAELDLIRSKLRQAVNPSGWVDANGSPFTPDTNLNMLSLRGSWYVMKGSTAGTFDTWDQAVTFPSNGQYTVQINASGRSMPPSVWGGPKAGKSYRLQVTATGGATLQMTLVDAGGTTVYATAQLGDGVAHVFNWPATAATLQLQLASGTAGGGKVSATLVPQ